MTGMPDPRALQGVRRASRPTLRWLPSVTLPTDELTRRFYRPAHLTPLCAQCENYGNNYACPPTGQDMAALLSTYARVRLYAARLPLPPTMARADTGAYFARGMVLFNRQLMASEAAEPGSLAVAPGQCVRCKRCARRDAKPCRHPESLRYSLDAFLLEIAQMSAELFGMEIQWYNDQPPPYLTMMGGLLLPTGSVGCGADGSEGTEIASPEQPSVPRPGKDAEIGREDR